MAQQSHWCNHFVQANADRWSGFAQFDATVVDDFRHSTGHSMGYGAGISLYFRELGCIPGLVDRFIVAKIRKATYKVLQSGPTFARPVSDNAAIKAQAIFKEKLHWRGPLKGVLEPTEKD